MREVKLRAGTFYWHVYDAESGVQLYCSQSYKACEQWVVDNNYNIYWS